MFFSVDSRLRENDDRDVGERSENAGMPGRVLGGRQASKHTPSPLTLREGGIPRLREHDDGNPLVFPLTKGEG